MNISEISEISIISIPQFRIVELEKEIKKINNKGKKFGNGGISTNIVASYEKTIIVEDSNKVSRRVVVKFVDIQILGNVPTLSGWKLLGVIEYNPLVIHTMFNEVIPESYWNDRSYCDHCNSLRNRNKTIIISKDGIIKQIGSTCIKDYLGLSATQVLGYLESLQSFLNTFDDNFSYSHNDLDYYGIDPIELIADAIRIISVYGFIKTSDENIELGKISTKSRLLEYYFGSIEAINHIRSRMDSSIGIEDAENRAKLIIEWVENSDNNSEFMFNIRNIIKQSVRIRHFGYIAGIVACYNKEFDNKTTDDNGFINEYMVEAIKSRISIEVRLLSIKTIEGYYGISYLHRFINKSGNEIIWFSTSGCLVDDIDTNIWLNITGTIKEKNEYNGRKQTYINRVKLNK